MKRKNAFPTLAASVLVSFLVSCADPEGPPPDALILDVHPQPSSSTDRIFGREFELTRHSRITLKRSENVGQSEAVPDEFSFSRYAGRVVVSGGRLAPAGHFIVVDPAAGESLPSPQPTGKLSSGIPKFSIILYDISERASGNFEGRFRVYAADSILEGRATMTANIDGDTLSLRTILPLPAAGDTVSGEPFAEIFGNRSDFRLELHAATNTASSSLIDISDAGRPVESPPAGRRKANPSPAEKSESASPETESARRKVNPPRSPIDPGG